MIHPLTKPRNLLWVLLALAALWLLWGSLRNPHFWLTASQQGDRLMHHKQYQEAAGTYQNPWQIGTAQYRNGDFEDAAKTFARVPGAKGAYNQGNAYLMHGAYDDAIASYQKALGFQPGWQDAADNMAIARARQKRIDDAGKDRDQESAGAYEPDELVFDQDKGSDDNDKPIDMNEQSLSDEALRATWLRRVQTTPADFLQAKFAWQAAHNEPAVEPVDGETP